MESGKTTTSDDAALDIDTLAADLLAVLKEVFPDRQSNPNLVLVGHSMVSGDCTTLTEVGVTEVGAETVEVVLGRQRCGQGLCLNTEGSWQCGWGRQPRCGRRCALCVRDISACFHLLTCYRRHGLGGAQQHDGHHLDPP